MAPGLLTVAHASDLRVLWYRNIVIYGSITSDTNSPISMLNTRAVRQFLIFTAIAWRVKSDLGPITCSRIHSGA